LTTTDAAHRGMPRERLDRGFSMRAAIYDTLRQITTRPSHHAPEEGHPALLR